MTHHNFTGRERGRSNEHEEHEMTTTITEHEDVEALAAQLKAKIAEVGAATDELAGLRQEVERVAIEGGDTRAARERVAEAVAAQEDRETQRGHLERMLDRARQGRRRRAAFAEMAAVYEAQAADLRIVLEVNAAREVMEAAQARRRSVEPSGIVQRRVHGVLLGRGPKMQETPPAELVIEHVPFVTNADWQDQEQVLAQAERFERLAADARGEATG